MWDKTQSQKCLLNLPTKGVARSPKSPMKQMIHTNMAMFFKVKPQTLALQPALYTHQPVQNIPSNTKPRYQLVIIVLYFPYTYLPPQKPHCCDCKSNTETNQDKQHTGDFQPNVKTFTDCRIISCLVNELRTGGLVSYITLPDLDAFITFHYLQLLRRFTWKLF